MELLEPLLSTLADWLRDHSHEISLSFIASFLTIFGGDIMRLVRKQIGQLQYILKITLFIIFCAFGFALLTSFLVPLMTSQFNELSDLALITSIILSFYAIGYFAQKKGLL